MIIKLARTLCLVLLALTVQACCAGRDLQVVQHTITVSEFTADIEQSKAVVSGEAVNTGPWVIGEVGVDVRYYDYQGNIIANRSTAVFQLKPGERWAFSVDFAGRDAWKVASYDISAYCK